MGTWTTLALVLLTILVCSGIGWWVGSAIKWVRKVNGALAAVGDRDDKLWKASDGYPHPKETLWAHVNELNKLRAMDQREGQTVPHQYYFLLDQLLSDGVKCKACYDRGGNFEADGYNSAWHYDHCKKCGRAYGDIPQKKRSK